MLINKKGKKMKRIILSIAVLAALFACLFALSSCGGGRAPEGRCGALHAAMLMVPAERREAVRQAFIQKNGSEFCRELKTVHHTPCSQCVETAASLTETQE